MRRTTRTVRLALASLTLACSTVGAVAVGATPVAASPAPATAGTYVVKQDDTLFGIARKLKVSLDALLAANGMTTASVIHPGMVLQVPAGAAAPSSGTGSTGSSGSAGSTGGTAPAGTYTIQAGDSISAIATRHGLKYGALLKANNLKIDSVLIPGRTLIIPAGGTLVVSPTPAAPGPASSPTAPAAPAAAPAGTYTIQSGDSIFAIAAKHGLKMGPLMKANDLTVDSVLVPGRTLTIPAGGTLVASPTPAAAGQDGTQSAARAKIDTVLAYARAQLGKPWAFASAGPDSFDCSGLTKMAYQQIGVSLPHSSVLQANRGVAVDWFHQEIQAGDLIFMASSDAPGVIGHVGIAIDSKRWIHSPRAGDVVRQGFIPADDKLMAVRRYVTG